MSASLVRDFTVACLAAGAGAGMLLVLLVLALAAMLVPARRRYRELGER